MPLKQVVLHMTFVAVIAVAVIVGAVAQSKKGRTGAGWAFGTFLIALPWWFVVNIAVGYGAVTGEIDPSDKAVIDLTRALFVAGPVGALMLLIVATLPVKRSTDNKGEDAAKITEPENQGDSMPCPRCAETIKRAAAVCRFCGHELARAEGAGVTPSA